MKKDTPLFLKHTWINTPLGPMKAIGDESALYLLEFKDQKSLEKQIERLTKLNSGPIGPGMTPPLQSIEKELKAYFERSLTTFETPFLLVGSPFQCQVWEQLQKISFGKIQSYAEVSQALEKPTAYRAVANANGANKLAIVIPCHRVINSNGNLGGYDGGIFRKKFLIEHEKKVMLYQDNY